MLTADKLIAFFDTELGIDPSAVKEDTPLFSSGLIDSFSLLTVIDFLERSFSFRMNPMDVNLDHMDTVERMLAYCRQRVSK